MRILGVIPARLGSTRLANKPLQLLAGEPLITRVIERVREHGLVGELVVATDSALVAQVVERVGTRAVLTGSGHASGTDRVAEVARRREYAAFDAVANVQGDEPFLPREALAGAIGRVAAGDDIGTAAAPLDPRDAADPDRVKVVTDARGRALYFSRAPIPFRRDAKEPAGEPAGEPGDDRYWQHLGLYVYTRAALERWAGLSPSPAEEAERLEQLRALHHGLTIGVAPLSEAAPPGIDTADDLRRADAHWRATHRHALRG